MRIQNAHCGEEGVILHHDWLARVDHHLQGLAQSILTAVRGHEVVSAAGEVGGIHAVDGALEGSAKKPWNGFYFGHSKHLSQSAYKLLVVFWALNLKKILFWIFFKIHIKTNYQ